MRTSQDGIDLIIHFEGCQLPSLAQTEAWLRDDLRPVEEMVDRVVQVPLRQNEFDALVAFAYDLGTDTLRRADLLAFLNAQQHDRIADTFLEYDGLRERRAAERALFIAPPVRGIWQKFLAWLRE